MPFDPNQPAHKSPLASATMRAQLLALFEMIQNIPAGPQGEPGQPGADGGPGPEGPSGSPGEVTLSMLNDALAGTARNPTGLAPLATPFADPDTESLRVFCNAMLDHLLRQPT